MKVYRSFNNAVDKLHSDYFDDEDNFEGDMISYQDYFGEANSAYESALNLEASLASLLHDTKFEMAAKEKEYKDMLEDVSSKKSLIKHEFAEQVNKYSEGTDGLTELEVDMLNSLQIYRDMD